MSPFKECKQDNVTYMCILNWILPGGWWRSMIKCSKVCPLALKLIKQKVGASGSWFWLTLKVFEVLDSFMKWWYWKFLIMGATNITLLGKPLILMFCNVLYFLLFH